MTEIDYRTLLFTKRMPDGSSMQDADVVYQGQSRSEAASYANHAWDETARRTDASDVLIEIARRRGKKIWRQAAERSAYTGGALRWK